MTENKIKDEDDIKRIRLANGKYEFQFNEKTGELTCSRYDDDTWRSFLGDGAVLALFQFCYALAFSKTKDKE